MLFLWQTPLSDVIPLTRSFQSGTPGGTNAIGLECQGVSASDNCLEFRQLAIGGTLTGVVVAPAPAATPVPTSPLWLLGIMAGLLSLVAVRKLSKA